MQSKSTARIRHLRRTKARHELGNCRPIALLHTCIIYKNRNNLDQRTRTNHIRRGVKRDGKGRLTVCSPLEFNEFRLSFSHTPVSAHFGLILGIGSGALALSSAYYLPQRLHMLRWDDLVAQSTQHQNGCAPWDERNPLGRLPLLVTQEGEGR